MKVEQESKYDVNSAGQIIVRATGKPIPDDEPVFIFRASDRRALKHLMGYRDDCTNDEHATAVQRRVAQFAEFAELHPDRMKEPDTATPQAGA